LIYLNALNKYFCLTKSGLITAKPGYYIKD
jgi:hypothetical protein